MDNHPIPQDVTNFQFRLIGDMTLKQFGYILGGVLFAWIVLAFPVFFLLKLFLAGMCILFAVGVAFVPIEGRPADLMLLHFFKALFSPTQFIYQKTAIVHASSLQTTAADTPEEKKLNKVKVASGRKNEKIEVASFTPTATVAVKETLERHAEEKKEETEAISKTAEQKSPSPTTVESEKAQEEIKQLTQELASAKAEEAKIQQGTTVASEAHEKVTDLEKQLQEVVLQKQELEKQLIFLQKSLAEKKQQVFSPTTADIPQQTQHVKKIPKQISAGVGTPLVPDVPNLITGVVKDPRGNVLGNILIEVMDKDGNPVRAFKTNQLGQFAAATPLTNGIYTISFEDPAGKQSFDSVEITATGEILLPLEITSVDAREKLRQELFGASPTT